MRSILRYIILILLSTSISAQIITFKKSLPKLNNDNIFTFSIKQSIDGKFIMGLGSTKTAMIYKMDEYGYGEWKKYINAYESTSEIFVSVETDNEGNYYSSCIDSGKINVMKYDKEGNVLWKIYSTAFVSGGEASIVFTKNNSLLIVGGSSTDQTLTVMNINTDGKILWEKSCGLNLHALRKIKIKLLKDNGYAVYAKPPLGAGKLYRFSQEGDSLWSSTLDNKDFTVVPTDNGFLFACDSTIRFMNEFGDFIWTKSYSGTYRAGYAGSDGNYFFAGSKLLKINISGDEIWLKDIPSSVNDIIETKDGGLVCIGSMTVFKTTAEGICKFINLDGLSTIIAGLPAKIYWASDNSIKNVNLQYSTDSGINWINIAQNISNQGYYDWIVPEFLTENSLLYISDAENPLVIDKISFKIGYNLNEDYIAINQIMMWMINSGIGSWNPKMDGAGLSWPGGESSSTSVVFTDGLVWGGLVDGQIRVNGSTYRTGLKPGNILEDGTADNADKLKFGIWKIRRDIETVALDKKKIYEYNFQNWPADIGAPYEDVNNDELFTRDIDKPKIYGDETFWFVANDLDIITSRYCYGSDPIGLEMQCTVYGYNRSDELGDVVFKKYKIINKGINTVDSMFLCYFVDPDLGFGGDDFVGCDTALNLGYCYNGDNNDEWINAEVPPAVGYCILKGASNPVMSRFSPNMKNFTDWNDPYIGNYQGSIQFYNYMNSKKPGGDPIIDPHTRDTVYFALAGDPINKTGWYEGEGWPPDFPQPADRRMNIITGPFNFAPGDTQEVVYAIVLARGTDNINSLKVLKDKVKAVRNFYYHGILNNNDGEKEKLITTYSLHQNYPNPFNPSTTISYSIPEMTNVELKIFDILGKEVMTLVNEEKPAGNYQVNFKATDIASGIYFYRIKTKDYFKTLKMIIIK